VEGRKPGEEDMVKVNHLILVALIALNLMIGAQLLGGDASADLDLAKAQGTAPDGSFVAVPIGLSTGSNTDGLAVVAKVRDHKNEEHMVVAMYHFEPSSRVQQVILSSVRRITWDLKLAEFNIEGRAQRAPSPSKVKEIYEKATEKDD
jgi:hypothetical protein